MPDQPAPALPTPGDLLWIDGAASVQFAQRPFPFFLIRIYSWSTYDGWIWLEGLHLDSDGATLQRRSIFVQVAGLRLAPAAHPRPDPGHYLRAVVREYREPDRPRRTR